MASTSAQVLLEVEEILYRIGRIDNIVDGANDLRPSDRHVLKVRIAQLFRDANEIFDWLGEQRIEKPVN